MKKKIFFVFLSFMGLVLLTGAGCASTIKNTETSSPVEGNTGTANEEVVEEVTNQDSRLASPSAVCSKEGTVTYVNTDETNTSWDIFLNNEKVQTLTRGGESAVYSWVEIPGMTFLAFDPSGLGGYSPLGNGHDTLIGVDHCTGAIMKFSDGNMSLMALSDDGTQLISVLPQSNGADSIRLWSVERSDMNTVTMIDSWTIPGDWMFSGNYVFNEDKTKVAFAVGNGPEEERGAVYILEFETGEFTKIQERIGGLLTVTGWNEDGSVEIK